MIVRRKPVHYKHDVVYYVPVFQEDYDFEGNLLSSPTFIYEMSHATPDLQTAWSFNPTYVLELRGHFDATTKPLVINEEDV